MSGYLNFKLSNYFAEELNLQLFAGFIEKAVQGAVLGSHDGSW